MIKSDITLLDYQKTGHEFLVKTGSSLLGDDVGLGKTLQALAFCEDPRIGAQRVLVLCPAILKDQWAEQIAKFVGEMDATTQVIDGKPEDRMRQWSADRANVSRTYFIANYELLLRDADAIRSIPWDVIISDEATRLSNVRNKQRKALVRVPARHRIALTGTPVSNRAEDVWGILDWCNPKSLGSWFNFMNFYVEKNKWGGIQNYRNLDHLALRIKPFYIRRTKEEVLPELPDKIISDVPFKLSDKEQRAYDVIRHEYFTDMFNMKDTEFSKLPEMMQVQNSLTKMLRLQQIADGMELVGSMSVSAKFEALQTILQGVENRKVIIFTKFSTMADILERELKCLKISGDVSNTDRQLVLARFNDRAACLDGKTNDILVMTSAGQYGLNIQAASVVIHYDQPFSIAELIQREGRAHRMGQKESVLVYNLLGKSTVDERVQKLLLKKQDLSDRLLMADIKEILK